MKVLVTGIRGQLGYDVIKVLKERGIEHIGTDIDDFDITDFEAVQKFIKNYMPDIVIHCSAYTAVDKAEDESDLCEMVNVEGMRNIALVCRDIDAKVVYFSTDYIFSGDESIEYDICDKPCPLSVYGKTKLGGEKALKELISKYFIIRISWVFGKNGNNFIKTMLKLGKEKKEVSIVSDQIGSPTYTADLAPLICDMMVTEKYGMYHVTNEGYCSWAEFAQEIFNQAGYNTKVNFILASEYPAKAIRPKNSKMSKKSLDKNNFKRLPNWKDALKRYLKELE